MRDHTADAYRVELAFELDYVFEKKELPVEAFLQLLREEHGEVEILVRSLTECVFLVSGELAGLDWNELTASLLKRLDLEASKIEVTPHETESASGSDSDGDDDGLDDGELNAILGGLMDGVDEDELNLDTDHDDILPRHRVPTAVLAQLDAARPSGAEQKDVRSALDRINDLVGSNPLRSWPKSWRWWRRRSSRRVPRAPLPRAAISSRWGMAMA